MIDAVEREKKSEEYTIVFFAAAAAAIHWAVRIGAADKMIKYTDGVGKSKFYA